MKHTPGPWILEFQGLEAAKGSWCVLTKEGWSVPHCWIATVEGIRVGPSNQEEVDGNAHLIAAAPDMYEALKAMFEELDDRYDGAPDSRVLWMGEHLTNIRIALAKAEGRQ